MAFRKSGWLYSVTLVVTLLAPQFLDAAPSLKKVAVLELVNLDKNSNVEYLSGSMTDAMEEKLSGKFSYQKADKRELTRVAEENFLYKDDFATKSVALNLGLLTKQDVVIAGGFSVRKGGKGVWGAIPMAPTTPDKLSDADLKAVIAWILQAR